MGGSRVRATTLAGALLAGATAWGADAPPAGPTADPFHDLLIPVEACDAPPAEVVDREGALRDLQVVERVLRGGYAGFDPLARRGFDWDGLFAAARAAVEAMPSPAPARDFQDLLVRAFLPVGDNHLAFYLVQGDGRRRWRSTGGHEDAYLAPGLRAIRDGGRFRVEAGAEVPGIPAGSEVIDCRGRPPDEVMRPVARAEGAGWTWAPIVLSRGEPPPLQCRFRGAGGEAVAVVLPLRRLRMGGEDEEGGEAFARREGEVPYLRVRSFGADHAEALGAFVATAPGLREAPAIVVDLRGNGGGSDRFARDWFVGLTSGELRHQIIERLRSDVTLQGEVNWTACARAAPDLEPEARAFIEGQHAAAVEALEAAARLGRPLREWAVASPVVRGEAPGPYRGGVVVLVDAGCASACESFVMYARQLPGTVVVGENTGGVWAFGEALTWRLPASGLFLQAGTKHFRSPDPRAGEVEGRGHLPDVWVDNEDAPAVALGLARCLSEPGCAARLRAELGRAPGGE